MIDHPFTHLEKFTSQDTIWIQCLEYIKHSCVNDRLYQNYSNIKPENYLYFNALTHHNKIVAFGGVEFSPSKWGIEIARVLTRFWIHPDYRSKFLTKWSEQKLRFTPLILKPQLNFLKTQNHINLVMITREGKYKNSFIEICRLASLVSADKFDILPDRYNICGYRSEENSCYQMLAISQISNIDKYNLFEKIQKLGFLKTYEKILH